MLCKSENITPDDGKKKPTNKFIKLDLPAPVFPKIPTTEFLFIDKFIFSKTKSFELSYLK